MKLTKKWLKNKDACSEGVEWFVEQKERDVAKIIRKLIKDGSEEKLEWANWLITRKFIKKQNVAYAIYAAEQVIKNFEDKYPDDKRPREAIQAAKRYLKHPIERNRSAAESAWSAARSAAESARSAAWSAAWSAESGESAWSATLIKILRYGIKLLKGSA